MKRLLISTVCAIFIFETACAREVPLSPTFTLHGSTIFAARHVAQSNSAVGATGESFVLAVGCAELPQHF
jgi:hypothetical protein